MKFIVLPLLLCISLLSNAQLHWALQAGGQSSTATYKIDGNSIPTGNVTGFKAGVQTKVYVDTRIAFVSGVQFNSRGFSVKTSDTDPQITYRFNYIDVPLMFQFDLSRKAGRGLYLKAGPSVSFGLSGTQSSTDTDGKTTNSKAVMSVSGNHFGLVDAAVNGVLGYSFTRSFFMEAGYAYGIGNINNDPNGPNIRSRVASLGIGYYLK